MAAATVVAATAQTTPQPATSDNPDIDFRADVQAQSVKFDTVPNNAHINVTGVNSSGAPVVTRTNLPRHPVAGTTYHNVGVHLRITSQFHDPNALPTKAPR